MAGKSGKSGRKKKPVALKKLQKTYRKDRDEPAFTIPSETYPEMPPGLHPRAQKEWKRVTPLAVQYGILTAADWLAWEMGFLAYSVFLKANDESDELVSEGEKGDYTRPEVWIMKSYWSMVMQWCQQFGLTASSRAGIRIEPEVNDAQKSTEKNSKISIMLNRANVG